MLDKSLYSRFRNEFNQPKMPLIMGILCVGCAGISIMGCNETYPPNIDTLTQHSGQEIVEIKESQRTKYFFFTDKTLFLFLDNNTAISYSNAQPKYEEFSKSLSDNNGKMTFLVDPKPKTNHALGITWYWIMEAKKK